MDGLTESEREALEKARLNSQGPTGPDELMERVYEKSGLDPLQVHDRQDPNRIMARAMGPLIALGWNTACSCWRVEALVRMVALLFLGRRSCYARRGVADLLGRGIWHYLLQ